MESMKLLTVPGLLGVSGLAHGFGQRVPGARQVARDAAKNTFKDSGEVFFLRQVHGATVVRPPWTESPDADASLTEEKGVLLAIETADCLPVLIVDPANRRVAAAHAGWRGTAARVAQAAVQSMVAAGSRPEQLRAALGPSIGPCCYEVGADVEAAFGEGGSKFFVSGPARRKHLDVVAANRAQIEEAGVPSSQIESVNLCTRCREDLFFSYRRDGANAGRMISVVGFSRSWSSP
jgi:polyphenol oxidase